MPDRHAKADDIIVAAKDLLGIRYRKQGRNSSGLDCAGVLIKVAHATGLTTLDTTQYSSRPNAEEFVAFMRKTGCKRLRVDQLETGDILRLNTHGWPVHCAVYEKDTIGKEWCIHAYMPHKKVTRDPLTQTMWDSVEDVWRFPEKT